MAVRCVTSLDAMTADWARLPGEVLQAMGTRIINEVKGITEWSTTSRRSHPRRSSGSKRPKATNSEGLADSLARSEVEKGASGRAEPPEVGVE